MQKSVVPDKPFEDGDTIICIKSIPELEIDENSIWIASEVAYCCKWSVDIIKIDCISLCETCMTIQIGARINCNHFRKINPFKQNNFHATNRSKSLDDVS